VYAAHDSADRATSKPASTRTGLKSRYLFARVHAGPGFVAESQHMRVSNAASAIANGRKLFFRTPSSH
jgi:hypothetical protein